MESATSAPSFNITKDTSFAEVMKMLEWIRDNDLPPGMEFISFSDRVAAVPAWHSVNRNPFNPDQEKEFEKLFKNICETHFSRNGHSGSAK